MGLDIYLSHYTNYQQSKANEKAFEEISDNLYEAVKSVEGEELTEDAKKRITTTLSMEAEKLGLDKWGCDETYCSRVIMDSKLHPEHYFKIGYFRSSYNSGGINNVLRDLGIPDLYDIFEHNENDGYEFCPDWSNALRVVQKSIDLLKKDKGYRIESISPNLFSPDDVPQSPAAAMEIFKQQLKGKSRNKNFQCYSNKSGEFYLDNVGLKVYGMIPGKDMFDRQCTYVVYKQNDGNKSYLQALEIVKEAIEYVLAQKNPQEYYLHWSA